MKRFCGLPCLGFVPAIKHRTTYQLSFCDRQISFVSPPNIIHGLTKQISQCKYRGTGSLLGMEACFIRKHVRILKDFRQSTQGGRNKAGKRRAFISVKLTPLQFCSSPYESLVDYCVVSFYFRSCSDSN